MFAVIFLICLTIWFLVLRTLFQNKVKDGQSSNAGMDEFNQLKNENSPKMIDILLKYELDDLKSHKHAKKKK